jgi:hypothetical protein
MNTNQSMTIKEFKKLSNFHSTMVDYSNEHKPTKHYKLIGKPVIINKDPLNLCAPEYRRLSEENTTKEQLIIGTPLSVSEVKFKHKTHIKTQAVYRYRVLDETEYNNNVFNNLGYVKKDFIYDRYLVTLDKYNRLKLRALIQCNPKTISELILTNDTSVVYLSGNEPKLFRRSSTNKFFTIKDLYSTHMEINTVPYDNFSTGRSYYSDMNNKSKGIAIRSIRLDDVI